MALYEITREAVVKAISEYDRLGRKEFLRKYSFADAKKYYLLHNGNEYPSKAIIGVAHQYIGDGGKPLTWRDFSGGNDTVKYRLEKIGFTVIVKNVDEESNRKYPVTGYWTFFCNPKVWQLDKFLRKGLVDDYWQFNTWYLEECKPGQLGVIRVGRDDRSIKELDGSPRLERGIYAIIEILSKPMDRREAPDEFWLDWEESDWDKPVVKVRYIHNLINSPLLLTEIENNPVINQDKLLITGFQNVCMPLREDVFRYILESIDNEVQFTTVIESDDQEQADNFEKVARLEDKYRDAVPEVKEVISRRIERGPVSKKIKELSNYKCMVCECLGNNPYSFKKRNGEPYVEAHHIIPVSNRIKGSLNISNIITVCANHHRQMHFGDTEIVSDVGDTLVIKLDGEIINIKKISAIL